LTGLFAEKAVKTKHEAHVVFLAEEKKSPASLCFAALLYPWNVVLLRQSADLGYPLAQARMASYTRGEERFRMANSAASERDREGIFWLGYCCQIGDGCEKDLDKARECYLVAAQLGLVLSMNALGFLLDESDPQRWFQWCRAAVLGDPNTFLADFSAQVEKFNSGSGNSSVMFQIGRALNGHVNVEERTIFGNKYVFDNHIVPANSSISIYKAQLAACRRAVNAWSHVGIHCGVVKDIRVFIGKLVWETRDLALYKIGLSESDAITPKKKTCVCF
jgi:hypothetical protein